MADQNPISFPILTERTCMRPVAPTDLDAIHAIIGDRTTTADVSWGQPDIASTAGWIARRAAQQEEHGFSMWAVELLQTDEVIGLCGFFPHQATKIELGYVIRADLWGQGLAPEVATAAIRSAIEADYDIFATIRPTNERSKAVARRIGLSHTSDVTDPKGRLLVYTPIAAQSQQSQIGT